VSELLDNALALASRGYAVFPLQPRSKLPYPHMRGFLDATTDAEQVRKWWSVPGAEESNIAVRPAPGVVVVDVDKRNGGMEAMAALAAEGKDLPETLTVKTGGGGLHAFYTVPADLSWPKGISPGIDLKAENGYLVAAPSVHESGARYEWIDVRPMVQAPAWLIALGRPKNDPVSVTVVDEDEAECQPEETIAAVGAQLTPVFTEGRKHALSFAAAGWLRQRGWNQSDIVRVIRQLPSKNPSARVKDALDGYRATNDHGWHTIRQLIGDEAAAALDAVTPNPKREAQFAAANAFAEGLSSGAVVLPPRQPITYTVPATSIVNANAAASANALAERERRTDLGNARRLVRLRGADLRYFKARGVWYCWDGVRWKEDSTGAAIRAAKDTAEDIWREAELEPDDDKRKAAFKWAAQCQDRARITNMIALAESEPGIAIAAGQLDADPWLLNVQNGTLDLRTGQLHAPRRELLMTKVTAAPYVAGARSSLWDSFVTRLTGGDLEFAAYAQRAMGYALFGAWREKMFWFGYGPPDGSKSTFLGVLSDVLGDYAVAADASTWMLQHNTGGNRGDVTRLMGARLVTTSEVRPSARFDPQLMKGVTGGDTLTAAAKYEAEISFRPTFALWFGANERPLIPDDDDGFWNRVRCVPFTNVIPKEEQDKALREKLTDAQHAPAVLAWAVQGFAGWQAHGIGTCAAVEAATTRYRRDMNQAAGFFDECCQLTGNDSDTVIAGALRAAYDGWCRSNGVQRPLTGKAWRKRLLALGVQGGDDSSRINGQRHWFGLRLRAGEGLQ